MSRFFPLTDELIEYTSVALVDVESMSKTVFAKVRVIQWDILRKQSEPTESPRVDLYWVAGSHLKSIVCYIGGT